jgi:hypothetical protein
MQQCSSTLDVDQEVSVCIHVVLTWLSRENFTISRSGVAGLGEAGRSVFTWIWIDAM